MFRFCYKLRLFKFFNDQTENFDPTQIQETEFDFNLDEVKEEVEDALEVAKQMGTRLEELNESMIQYLIQNSSSKQAKYDFFSRLIIF